MSSYKVFVRSRGKKRDYDWSEPKPSTSSRAEVVQRRLEGSTYYAMQIEKVGSSFNLGCHVFMPEVIDKVATRIIRLELWLEDLTETQARALAIAHLNMPVNGNYRYCPEIARAYSATDDGYYTVDEKLLRDAIDKLISTNEKSLQGNSPDCRLELREKTLGTMQSKAIEQLSQYTLTDKEGVKVLLREAIIDSNADLSLCAFAEVNREKRIPVEPDPEAPSPEPPVEVPATERPSQEGELTPAQITAPEMAEEVKQPDGAPPSGVPLDQLKKCIVGCVILLVIVGIVFILQGRNASTTSLEVFSSLSCQMKVHGKTYEISAHVPREIPLPGSPNGVIILEILNDVARSTVLLNDAVISKGVDGKYSIPAQGGKLQILPPKS